MRTFTEKPKLTHQATSPKVTVRNRSSFLHKSDVHPRLHLQHPIENQTGVQTNAEELNPLLLWTNASCFGHDFSQVPVTPRSSGAVQTKLEINKPGDEYEQEADRVAEQIMRMHEPKLQRPRTDRVGETPCGAEIERPELNKKIVQAKHKRENVAEIGKAPAIVQQVISSPGRHLNDSTRAFFEPRFGHDFSSVRVHTDSQASEAAQAISAKAFAVGQDIVFGQGQYAPETDGGRSLLAHELTHVLQQSSNQKVRHPGVSTPSRSRSISVQRNPSIPDFIDIARRLHAAMEGFGTDEQAIFTALGELGVDREAGEELKRVYQNMFNATLEADLRGELSGDDLTRALQLLNPGGTTGGAAPSLGQGRRAQLGAKVRSIDKDGTATLSLHQDPATRKLSGYQLHQTFRAEFDQTARASNYAIIQWIRGELYETRNGNRVYWPASMGLFGRGDTQPWRFTDWVIDTPDADPRFGSNRGVAINVPTTRFDDAPGVIQNSGPLPAGLHWEVEARVGVYPWGTGVPKYIAGWESQRPQPFAEKAWGWTVEVNTDQLSLGVNIT